MADHPLPAERHVPLLDHLGIEPVEAGEGRAVFEMTVDDRHLRTLGLLHGGVTAALLDTAMGFAAVTVAPEGHHPVTIQINVNFVRAVQEGERLRARGEVRHSGRQTAVTFGEVQTSDGRLAATATATFLFVPVPAAEAGRG
ncbi:MAG TPA: PaaI family thioesterase [Planctomycetaceae bacterium]|nr:PaaI family thioesterase [Planctomycetaceae bacterium]